MHTCLSAVPAQEMKMEQKAAGFFARTLVMAYDKRFRGRDEVYFATLTWHKKCHEGAPYYIARVLALHDVETDQRILDRAIRFLKRSSVKWDVLDHSLDAAGDTYAVERFVDSFVHW